MNKKAEVYKKFLEENKINWGDVFEVPKADEVPEESFMHPVVFRSAIGIQKGSGKPHAEKVGKITRAQLAEIAEAKKDQLNAIDEEGRIKVIAGTARSMGVEVTD